MKGIILAGGAGTRLHPVTKVISKQLLPVYDKPMIYYPLSVLMLAGIKDILIITTPKDSPMFSELLGDGSQWNVRISYEIQENPNGLAEAFVIGEAFVGDDAACLILGDNIFFGHNLTALLKDCVTTIETEGGAVIVGYYVKDPERYGVMALDKDKRVLDIEEKPTHPKSNYAVVGLYFYDKTVIQKAKCLKPSARNELEITDLNKVYLNEGTLKARFMGRGYAWLDTGTHDSLLAAGSFVKTIEDRQGMKIADLDEIAKFLAEGRIDMI